MSHFYSPLRYPGGKNCIFKFVSKFIAENNLTGVRYAEPYAGGSGLSLRLLAEGYVDHIYINDLDQCIYSFWTSILDYPTEFIDWVSNVEVSIDNWLFFREVYQNPGKVGAFDLARATFFMNRTNVSGVLKGGVIGGISQQGKYKIDARFNKHDLVSRIEKISSMRNRISVSNLDGLKFIQKLDNQREQVFIYLDPPYFQKGADLYMNSYSKADHKKLAKQVRKLKSRWMVSYDNHEFILNLYKDEDKVLYKLSQSASNRVGDEILVFSPHVEYKSITNNLNGALHI